MLPCMVDAPRSPSQGTQPTSTYVMRWREQSQNSISMASSCLDSPVSLFRHSKKSFNPPWGPSSQINAHSLGSRSSRYVRPGKGQKAKFQAGTPAALQLPPFQWERPTLRPMCKTRCEHPQEPPQQRQLTQVDAHKCQTPLGTGREQPLAAEPSAAPFYKWTQLWPLAHGWSPPDKEPRSVCCSSMFKSGNQLLSEGTLKHHRQSLVLEV